MVAKKAVHLDAAQDKVLHVSASVDSKSKTSTKVKSNNWLATAGAQFVFVAALLLLAVGFYQRGSEYFVPGEGVAYVLGITGGVLMLLLLLYPLVKRSTRLGFQKHSVFWLRVHMLLGTIGPLLIFYHSNFSFGATNSNIALLSMIMVAISGVLGRYIYTRVYKGMSSVRLDLGTLLANSTRLMATVGADTGGNEARAVGLMADFAKSALSGGGGFFFNLLNALTMSLRASFARTRIIREARNTLRANAIALNWSKSEERRRFNLVRSNVSEFLFFVGKASQLMFWERMFSLWHILHVPLFFVLLVSSLIHVFAVHVY